MRLSFVAVVGVLGLITMACEKPIDASEAAAASDSALSATAQCVRQATDAELIAELQARLAASGSSSGSSGDVSTDTAVCTFSCDTSTNLTISVVAPDGSEKTKTIFTGSGGTCQNLAEKLAQTRATITHVSLIAVCDTSTNLHRYSVTPAGQLTELAAQFTGSAGSCANQADAINR
jgi:hypothetical protein